MALSAVTRTRVIMDLVKDATVTNEAEYNDGTVDLLDGTTAIKYAQAFWDQYYVQDPDNPIPSPTNAQLATNYLLQMREYHKQVLRSVRLPSAADTARDAEEITVNSEVDTDLRDWLMTDINEIATEATTAESTNLLYAGRSPFGATDDRKITVDNLLGTYGEPVINVKAADYGAIGNGVADDSTAIQAAFDALGTYGGTVVFPPGTYLLGTAIDLWTNIAGDDTVVNVVGVGMPVIKADTTATGCFDRSPPDQSATSLGSSRFTFSNLRIRGTSQAGQFGIRLGRVRHSLVEQCHFEMELDYGIVLGFALESQVDRCEIQGLENGLYVGLGWWSGATGNNAASNVFSARNTRFFGNGAATSGAGGSSSKIFSTSGASFINCVWEGGYPSIYDCEFDSNNSSIIHGGMDLIDCHFEHDGAQWGTANIGLGTGAQPNTFSMRNVNHFDSYLPLIHSTKGSGGTVILIEGLRYALSGDFWDANYGNGAKWIFLGATIDPTDSTYWNSGNVPSGLMCIHTGAGDISLSGLALIEVVPTASTVTPILDLEADAVRIDAGPLCHTGETDAGTASGNQNFNLLSGYARYKVTLDGDATLAVGNGSATHNGAQIRWDITQNGAGGWTVTPNTASVLDEDGLLTAHSTTASTYMIVMAEWVDATNRAIITHVFDGLTVQ